jgi:protease PrsW
MRFASAPTPFEIRGLTPERAQSRCTLAAFLPNNPRPALPHLRQSLRSNPGPTRSIWSSTTRAVDRVTCEEAMLEALTMVSAVVPALLMLWYFHSRDTFPEPPRVVWTTFALGVLAIVPVLVVAFPIVLFIDVVGGGNPLVVGFMRAFFCAALVEEAFKLAVLAFYSGRHSTFDEPMDGLVYGATASLAFATLENVLYTVHGNLLLALTRGLSAVPMHACCGAIMGYFYGRSRFERHDRPRLLALAYFVPVILHGLYDFPLLTAGAIAGRATRPHPIFAILLMLVACLFLAITLAVTVVVVRRARREQAARGAPVPLPLAPPKVATTASRVGGCALALVGGIGASIGGMFVLAVLLMFTLGRREEGSLVPMLTALFLFGALPLLTGFATFMLAIRLLNRPRARPLALPRAA